MTPCHGIAWVLVGHEIRNPLHGVCAGVKALQDGTLSAAEAREELAAIAEGLKLILSVTNDMTDLRKLRAGQFVVCLAPTSLREVLESCVVSVQSMAAAATGGPGTPTQPDIQLVFDRHLPDMVRQRCGLRL